MREYNVICRCCGHENRHLFLEETDGWMECEVCLTLQHVAYPDPKPEEAGTVFQNVS